MNKKNAGFAIAAVLGTALTTVSLSAGSASAMPSEGCDASQLTTTIVPGSPGAGQRYAEIQFTAKDGQYCQLKGSVPVTLDGAPSVTVEPEAGQPDQVVHLRPGTSAHQLLHWTAIEASGDQATPSALTVHTPGTHAQTVTLPWQFGSLDASADAHTLRVGTVQEGPADAA